MRINMPRDCRQFNAERAVSKTVSANLFSIRPSNRSLQRVEIGNKSPDVGTSDIRIQPEMLEFFSERQELSIQNMSIKNLRVQIMQPRSKYYKVENENNMEYFWLPPGLSKKITVRRIHQEDEQDSYDLLPIRTEKYYYEVKLKYVKDRHQLTYDKLYDLKFVPLNGMDKNHFSFKNCGKAVCKVKLSRQTADQLKLDHEEFEVKPGQVENVEFKVQPNMVGTYLHTIYVIVDDKVLSPIQVVYSVYQLSYQIVNIKGEIVEKLDFGYLYYGSKKSLKVYGVNNTPKYVQLRSKIKIGGKNSQSLVSLQSPEELGIESSSSLIQVHPKVILLSPYSRSELTLTCTIPFSKNDEEKLSRLARSSMTNQALQNLLLRGIQKYKIDDKCDEQTLLCEFVQTEGTANWCTSETVSCHGSLLPTNMLIKYSLPNIRICPQTLNLGRIAINEPLNIKLRIQNCNKRQPCTVSFLKTLGIQIFSLQHAILPECSNQIDMVISPTRLGHFSSQVTIVVANCFQVHIPVIYQAACISYSFGNDFRTQSMQSGRLLSASMHGFRNSQICQKEYDMNNQTSVKGLSQKLKKAMLKSRSSLSSAFRLKTALMKPLAKDVQEDAADEEKQKFQFQLSDLLVKVNNKELSLADLVKKDSLFVTKKIDKYLPFEQLKDKKKLLKCKHMKQHFNMTIRRVAKNRQQMEEISMQLTPESLKLISINEKVLKFGKIFIKSSVQKDFVIENYSENIICVKLQPQQRTEANQRRLQMLAGSDYQQQIIQANSFARFRIVLEGLYCGRIDQIINYSINGQHNFQLLVEAEVELVALQISKPNLKLSYSDEVSDMLLKDNFVLKNQGNTAAEFKIEYNQSRLVVDTIEGVLQSGESKTIVVCSNNEKQPIVQAGEASLSSYYNYSKPNAGRLSSILLIDERIAIKVKNGNESILKVSSNPSLTEPKCMVKESKINFGYTIVSKPRSKSFVLKNMTRSICLFEIINTDCKQYLSFSHEKGKVSPEGSKQITVVYKSSIIHCLTSSFKVRIRGGLLINVPIQAQSIAPEVCVLENQFNFGDLRCGATAVAPINIRNDSEISVQLYLDLASQKENGSKYLSVSFPEDSRNKQNKTETQQNILDNVVKELKVHKIKLSSKSVMSFYLIFRPILADHYEFTLPIYLENYLTNQGITKMILCTATEPKFIVEPSVVNFKKRIINDKDSIMLCPFVEYLTLKNPTDKLQKWKLGNGTTKQIISDSELKISKTSIHKKTEDRQYQQDCFEMQCTYGQLSPNEFTRIIINFTPMEEGYFKQKVPLYIFQETKKEYYPEIQIVMEGQGRYPSLSFSKLELILPVVPLGVESIGTFDVINEGFEAISLKHRFDIVDSSGNFLISEGNLHADANRPEITVIFPQGTKMGSNKKKLPVIVKFLVKKPLSFTYMLKIYDESQTNLYTLPVSGTSDNSILTTFPYISDRQNIVRYEVSGSVKDADYKSNQGFSVMLRLNDGRNAVDRVHNSYQGLNTNHYSLDCEIIVRVLKNLLKQQKIIVFPRDVIKHKETLQKLIQKLTGRKDYELNDAAQSDGLSLEFCEGLVKQLKSMGCLLNHIRPYYLLEKEQFFAKLQSQPKWKSVADYYTLNYEALHVEAWIILFYQIMNTFWYNFSKPKGENTSYLQSNLYSAAQLQVIKWVKANYCELYPQEQSRDKFVSLAHDYRSCLAIVACLNHYVLPHRKKTLLQGIVKTPITPNYYNSNTKFLYQLFESLNIMPLIYEQEYQIIGEKEMFMLLYQLYQTLPHTRPKTPPVIFACELGLKDTKFLEIKNNSDFALCYEVKVEGSKHFHFDDKESIIVPPKSSHLFKVQFRSKLSTEQVAFITFVNKQSETNPVAGSAIVFELRSKITGWKSIKKLDSIYCPLYESICVKIPVDNCFQETEFCNFTINLFETVLPEPKVIRNGLLDDGNVRKQRGKAGDITNEDPEKSEAINFYTDTQSIKIKKNCAGSFQLVFCPMQLAKIRCFIVFNDPRVGQFQYELIGIPKIPKALQQLKYQSTLYVDSKETIELSLPLVNFSMIKCLNSLALRASSKQARPLRQKGLDSTQKETAVYKLELNMDASIKQYITFPHEVVIKCSRKQTSVDGGTKIKLDCLFPVLLKDLVLDFFLVSEDRKDVRRFRYALNLIYRPITQEMTMRTTARLPIVQKFPFQNFTSKDWKIKMTILQTESESFSLKQNEVCATRDFFVKKGQSSAASIYYQPMKVQQTSCKIILSNLATSQQIVYLIKGISEDPISEGHAVIKLRTEKQHTDSILITNPYCEKLVFKVVTDLPELRFPPSVLLGPNEIIDFQVQVQIASTANLVGFIKFVDELDRYFWYTVAIESEEIIVDQQQFRLQTSVGNDIVKQLQFANPLSEDVTFKLQLPENSGLIGLEEFPVGAKEKIIYQLTFKPTEPIDKDILLKAHCRQIGIFNYQIHLFANVVLKPKLISLVAEIAKTDTTLLKITNLKGKNATVSCKLSNYDNFQMQHPDKIKGRKDAFVKLTFKPSSEKVENCIVKIFLDGQQSNEYEVEGRGHSPNTIEQISFRASLGHSHSQIVKFVNPNPKKMKQQFTTSLQDIDGEHGSFRIVNHEKNNERMQVIDVAGIFILFEPKERGYFESTLYVNCFGYRWKYELKGTTTPDTQKQVPEEQLIMENKQQLIKIINVPIPSYLMRSKTAKYFNKVELNHSSEIVCNNLKKWVKIKLENLENPIPSTNASEKEKSIALPVGKEMAKGSSKEVKNSIVVYLRVKPLKSMDQLVWIVLSNDRSDKLKINYPVRIKVTPAKPEQVINLSVDHIRMINFSLKLSALHLETKQSLVSLKTSKNKYLRAERDQLGESIWLKFSPNHYTFDSNLSYRQHLTVQTDKAETVYEIIIKLGKQAKLL